MNRSKRKKGQIVPLGSSVVEVIKPSTTADMVRSMAEAMNKIMKDQVKKDRELLHLNLKVDAQEGIEVLHWLKKHREKKAKLEA